MKKNFNISDFLIGLLLALLVCLVFIDNRKTEYYNEQIYKLEDSRNYYEKQYEICRQQYIDSVINKSYE